VIAFKDVVTQIKEAAVSTVLAINGSKTNYTKINRNITNLVQEPIMDGEVFEGVQNFIYTVSEKDCTFLFF